MTAPAPPAASPIAPPARADLCLALNRISSALYLLACKYVAGRYDGSRRPHGSGARVASTAMSSPAAPAARIARKARAPGQGLRHRDLAAVRPALRAAGCCASWTRGRRRAVLEIGCATRRADAGAGAPLGRRQPDHRAGAVGAAGRARAGQGRRPTPRARAPDRDHADADAAAPDAGAARQRRSTSASRTWRWPTRPNRRARSPSWRACCKPGRHSGADAAAARHLGRVPRHLPRRPARRHGTSESLAALDAYVAALPDGDTCARWLKRPASADVEIAVDRWELLFKSAREFFFAPLIRAGTAVALEADRRARRRDAGRLLLREGGDRHLLRGPRLLGDDRRRLRQRLEEDRDVMSEGHRNHAAGERARYRALVRELGEHDRRYYVEMAPDDPRRRVRPPVPRAARARGGAPRLGRSPGRRPSAWRHADLGVSQGRARGADAVARQHLQRGRAAGVLRPRGQGPATARCRASWSSRRSTASASSCSTSTARFVHGATRGDGRIGEDITANVRTMRACR